MMDTSKVKPKQVKLSQSLMPRVTLKGALIISEAIRDNFAGKSASPLDIAKAVDRSPSSSDWRYLTGASIAYGLTTGAYNAAEIELTELGRKIVMALEEGEDQKALLESLFKPEVLRNFYQKYNANKFPRGEIAKNVLQSMGVPKERVDEALKIITENGRFLGVLVDIKGDIYVQISNQPKPIKKVDVDIEENGKAITDVERAGANIEPSTIKATIRKIFISHSKNTKILEQIKTVLELGDFGPVIAEEQETTAKPVPKKILDQMRECGSAVINVSADQQETKEDGTFIVNQNVLIEIGAAFVLYDEKVVLVWDKRVEVPSNLQGLYRCDYEGDELSWSAGAKLQKALLSIKRGEKLKDDKS